MKEKLTNFIKNIFGSKPKEKDNFLIRPEINIVENLNVPSTKKTTIIIFLSILLALNGLLLWQYYTKRTELTKVNIQLEITTLEKDSLNAELGRIKDDYKRISSNDSLMKVELSDKDKEIQDKIKEIEYLINNGDAAQLKKIRKKLETLKELNQIYLAQIDSLNIVNAELNDENDDLQNSLKKESNRSKKLAKKNIILSNKVAIGSALTLEKLVVYGVRYKKNGREVVTKKFSSSEKIKICCTILKNTLTEPGIKKVYIRILSPDGAIMSTSFETFLFNDKNTIYTIKEYFQYNNVDIDLCFYWARETQFIKGEYQIEVYCMNDLIGSTTMSLK